MTRLLKVSRSDLLHLFVIVTAGLQVASFFWQAGNSIALLLIARKEVPSLIQLVDGKAIAVSAVGSRERTSATIRAFVGDTLTLMFNMTGELSTDGSAVETLNARHDRGIAIPDVQNRITTASRDASFAVALDFRPELLKYVAQLTPEGVFEGRKRIILLTRYIGEPEQLRQGVWKVQYIGDLLYFSSNDEFGKPVPFNKEIFVRTVDPPRTPLGASATVLEKTVYALRQAGLEIYDMRQFERKNL